MLRPPPHSPRLLAFCIFAFTAGPVHAQFAVEGRDPPRIEELTFRGVEHVDEDDLRESLFTQATTCKSIVLQPFCWVTSSGTFLEKHYLDRTELERDELRTRVFYYRRGFRDAGVVSEVRPAGDGVAVTFTIQEGTPTRVRTITVRQTDPVLDESQIAATRLPTEGEPVSLIELDSVRVRMLEVLQNHGYADAQVRDTVGVDPDEATARVEISIDPARKTSIEDIVIRGNDEVSDRTIRRSIGLQPGDLYRRDELLESQRRLYESNLFRQTLITIEDTPDSAKTVVVSVREAPLRAFRTGFGFNTVDFVQTELGFTRYNWVGGARRLDLRAALGNLLAPQLNGVAFFYDHDLSPLGLSDEDGNPYLDPTWQLGADLTQPWFLSPKNSLGTSIFAHRRSVPSIVIDRGYGASASFTRRIADGAPFSAEYRFEISTVEAGDVYFCVNFGVCGRPTIASLRESHRLSPFRLGLLVNRADDPLFPTSGYNARLDFEHASGFTASDFRYNRLSGEISRYISLGPGIIAGRVRAGWIRPLGSTVDALDLADVRVHPRKRFYAGGSRSVRGYSENQLGPRVLTIAPEKLEDAGGAEACVAGGAGTCDLTAIPSDDFQPRPVGGTTVLEGSLEYRFPIWEEIGGAIFVDAATVGAEGGELPATDRKSAVTPGFGIRYASPVGPIRVDLGIKPTLTEELPVITEIIADDGTRRIVELGQTKIYDPLDDSGGWFRQVIDRLTLHLSIGEAF